VGLLVVLAVLGAMAAVAFTALGGSDGEPAARPSGLAAEVVPAARADLDAVAQSGQALRTGVADQASNACLVDARTLATAVAAYEASRGSHPASVDELVTAGLLAQAPSSPGYSVTLESAGGKSTGRVLVNGMEPAAGCEAPTG
jgi:hypothetical protein